MKRGLAPLIALSLPACAGIAGDHRQNAAAEAPVEVEVVRSGNSWTADFAFDRASPAWLFVRSPVTEEGGKPWRPQSWTVETRGVRIERRGLYDVLTGEGGGAVPRRVRVRFSPFSERVAAGYDPALVFTDGSVALFSEQFDTVPLSSSDAAQRLPADLEAAGLPESRTRVRFVDRAGPVLHEGRRVPSVSVSDDKGSYILFGPIKPITTQAMTAVIDPQLPQWIRRTLERAVPDMLGRYAALLGPAPGGKPMIMVSWAGPLPGRSSMGGSVLPGLIVMRFEGERILAESREARDFGLWFVAHEAAHFWLGQAVSYSSPNEAWITEGGAELLAMRMSAQVEPAYDARAALQQAIDDCARLAAGRAVATAAERSEPRTYYACGAVFALVAEAAAGGSFAGFVKRLIAEKGADGFVTRTEWLALLDTLSADPTLSRDIGLLLDSGAADPKEAIASLFAKAGIAHSRAADGSPRLL